MFIGYFQVLRIVFESVVWGVDRMGHVLEDISVSHLTTNGRLALRGRMRLVLPRLGRRRPGQRYTRAREISAFCRTAALTPAARQVP